MRSNGFLRAAAIIAFSATIANAQDLEIARRASIFSADGVKIGKIDQVVPGADGKPEAVKVIYRGKFVTIPASTLTSAEKGLTTSLSTASIRKM